MKKKIIIAAIILAAIFALALRFSKRQAAPVATTEKAPVSVSIQTAEKSKTLDQNIQYPAIIAGDQEITLTANVSGTITRLNFDLGDKVFQGKQLVTIDEIGNNSGIGENGLKSSNIQSLELAVESAEEAYKKAKRAYQDDKTYANKKSKEIAEIDLETAKVNLKGALNGRLVISPISGTITQRLVSQGDSVSIGQTIATISKTALTKVQFYVNKEDLSNFKIGSKVAISEDGNELPGTITRIAPEADPTTKRFLIEAKPTGKTPLLVGSVIYVSFNVNRVPATSGNLILPLSAITTGQNENHIFVNDNGKAKQISVEIKNVQGEFAEIKTDIPNDAQIIINGSKLVQNGDMITLQ